MKSDSSAGSWLKFFTDAGIDTPQAEHYAVTFSKNKIQLDMLPDINKEYLMDMGILLLGHIIAILRHAKRVHADILQEVKDTELLKTPGSNTVKEKTTVKPCKSVTSKTATHDDSPTIPIKRKSTVVQMNSTTERDEPKPKVRKNLCDSSDDIPTTKRIKPAVSSILASDSSTIDEAKKGVFKRLGNEMSNAAAESSSTPLACSSNESVFARLGGKTAVPQFINAQSVTCKLPLPSTKTPSVKIPVKKSIIRTRLDKPRLLVSAPYMDTVLEERNISSSSSISRPQDKHDIKRRLGFSAKSVTTQPSTTSSSKKVSFGSVFQKLIPRVKKPTLISSSLNGFNLQRKSIAVTSLGINSKLTSLGTSKGVFSRLGVK